MLFWLFADNERGWKVGTSKRGGIIIIFGRVRAAERLISGGDFGCGFCGVAAHSRIF